MCLFNSSKAAEIRKKKCMNEISKVNATTDRPGLRTAGRLSITNQLLIKVTYECPTSDQ